MNIIRTRPCVAGLFACLLSSLFASVARAAEPVELQLHRPCRAGEFFHRSTEVNETVDIVGRTPGQADVDQTHRVGVKLDAVVKVLDVDPAGRPIAEALTIRKAELSMDGGAYAQVLEPGRVIIAKRVAGVTIFRAQQGGLTPEANLALRYAVRYPAQGAPTADQDFNPGKPVEPGATWPAHVESLARTLATQDIIALPGALDAHARLVENTRLDGRPASKIATAVETKNFTIRGDGMPETRDTAMTLDSLITLPADPTVRASDQRVKSEISFTIPRPDGATIEQHVKVTVDVKIRPLPAARDSVK